MERLKEEQDAANNKNPDQTSVHESANEELDKAAKKMKKQASKNNIKSKIKKVNRTKEDDA